VSNFLNTTFVASRLKTIFAVEDIDPPPKPIHTNIKKLTARYVRAGDRYFKI